MFEYDKEHGRLIISKMPVRKPSTVYKESEFHKSYRKYVEDGGIIDDIEEYVLKPLNEALAKDSAKDQVLWLQREKNEDTKGSYVVSYKEKESFRNDKHMEVWVSIGSYAYPQGAKSFPILKIPYMDESGVIYKGDRLLALIGSLVQDDDITYDNGELKVITKAGFYNLKRSNKNSDVDKGKIYMEFKGGKEKVNPVILMFALAKREGLDMDELITMVKRIPCLQSIITESSLETYKEYAEELMAGIIQDCVDNPRYSLKDVRRKLDETLSLDRAIGKICADAIQYEGEDILVTREEVITASVLEQVKAHKGTTVTVKTSPNLEGTFLAERVCLDRLRRGTELIPEIIDKVKEVYPEVKGRYLDKSLELKGANQIILWEDTGVSKKLLEALQFNGVREIYVKEKKDSKNIKLVSFDVEVISNGCVLASDIGIDVDGANPYVYIGKKGEVNTDVRDKLMAYDILAMLSLYDRLLFNEDMGSIASRDLGLRKKVHLVPELFGSALRTAGQEFAIYIKNTLKSVFVSTGNSEFKAGLQNEPGEMEKKFAKLSVWFWRALYKKKVIQSVDRTNPTAFYSSLEKVNTIVKNKHTISDSMRWMTMGHYGKLCPYEIPSGGKLGTVNNLAQFCIIEDGIMKTPYRRVMKIGKRFFLNEKWEYLSVSEEEKFRIADITSLDVDEHNEIHKRGRVLARIPSQNALEKMEVALVDVEYIKYASVDPQQSISPVCATIPFQGSNDAARVTYEISQVKQAKPLLYAEAPIVSTSASYDLVRKSPYFMIQAEYDGEVVDLTSNSITMKYDTDDVTEPVMYEFKQKEFSNTSIIVRVVEVEVGQKVKAGHILVSSNFVRNGELALGVNVLTGHITNGYNYEDGIFNCEALRYQTTSYSAVVEKTPIPKKAKSVQVVPTSKFRYINRGGFMARAYYIYNKASEKPNRSLFSKKLKGFVVDAYKEVDSFTKKDTNIVVEAVDFKRAEPGDKYSNRHGNKGVAPKFYKNEDMPRFKNGEFLRLIHNPLGVPSRMNVGQILELNLGLAMYVLGSKAQCDSFNGANEEDIKGLLKFAWRLANEDDIEQVVKDNPQYPAEWVADVLTHMEWIKSWKGAFNEDGTAYMYNPKRDKMYETPILVGVSYIYKLVQEGDKKLHGRGGYLTARYNYKSDDPTKGAAKGGGQRMGDMELFGLAAYGASNYIQELLNERCDNAVARNNLTVEYAYGKDSEFMLPEEVGIRRSTEEFMCKLRSLGTIVEFTSDKNGPQELPNLNEEENGARRVWSATTLLLKGDGSGSEESDKGKKKVTSVEDFDKEFE